MTITNKKPNKGFFVSSNRISKAKKIVSILEEESNSDLSHCTILDIGTGNGEISDFLQDIAESVISIDISDNRVSTGNYDFVLCNENLPFKEGLFDIVISNHVIEHVSDNKLHLQEINRVLKATGIVYLATPNRLWPWEVHYQIPVLHYLPINIFIKLLKRLNIYHEDLSLLFWHQLKKLTQINYTLATYCDKVAREPHKYHMPIGEKKEKLLKFFPLKLYSLATFINPTFIITLRKKSDISKNR